MLSPGRFETVVEELQEAWLARMRHADQIHRGQDRICCGLPITLQIEGVAGPVTAAIH